MENFFDYIFIRIFLWYESFRDSASVFTAKILVVFLKVFILSDVVALVSYLTPVTRFFYYTFGLTTTIIFFFLDTKRYSDKKFIDMLIKKWKGEGRMIRILKGYAIVCLLITVLFGFIILGRNSPYFEK